MSKVTFIVQYHTHWGENLFLETAPGLAGQSAAQAASPADTAPLPSQIPLAHLGGGLWAVSLDAGPAGRTLRYRYVVRADSGTPRVEPAWRALHRTLCDLSVHDQWLSVEEPDAAFLRQAFAGVIFQPDVEGDPLVEPAPGWLVLSLRAPRVPHGLKLAVTGNHPALGSWDPKRAVVMSGALYPTWRIAFPLALFDHPIEYKFGLWDPASGGLQSIEAGTSRWFGPAPAEAQSVLVQAEHFRHPAPWKGAGVAIPVFALRSERGYGIGEFSDLEPLAAWAAGCGMHLIQVLPVNDTSSDFTWRDSYPYKGISTAALHPIYLRVDTLYEEAKLPLPPGFLERRSALNQLPQLDYEQVLRDKLSYLRGLYAAAGARTLRSRAFKNYWQAESDWLKPYAAFCRLRDLHGTAEFRRWGTHAVYCAKTLDPWFKPKAPEYPEVMFHAFLQFHLRQQLNRALAAGHASNVAFKGDLPIGIDRHSVEAWTQPDLFHMDRQTGAPPDTFSRIGQNWGFPTYDWRRMEATGYAWWHARFQRMSACFDALRIDHILGFFRIWEIPGDRAEGIFGHFNPTLPLSREDLVAAGFARDPAGFAEPAASAETLSALFAEIAPPALAELFLRHDDGFYRLRPVYREAAALEAWTRVHCGEAQAARFAEALREFSYEILFLPDPDQSGRWHPRVNLHETRIFQALLPFEREALRLVHDNYFYRRHTRFWEDEAMKKLPALMEASAMLICGEDLGMIPDSVPVVLNRLGLLSLEIPRMPKRPGEFMGDPSEYPYFSVCTTSSHDLSSLRGMWQEEPPARDYLWRNVLHRPDAPPRECPPEVCRQLLALNLAAGSMWCIPPLQDWLGMDAALRHPDAAAERINVPANPRHYWRYRMHLTLETLLGASAFNQAVAQLIKASGRA